MATKSLSEEMHEEARGPVLDWGLVKFVLGVIALLGFMYGVHLLIHMW